MKWRFGITISATTTETECWILQPLTDKSRRKLQSTEDFINASFHIWCEIAFTSIPLQLTLQCTETAIGQSTDPLSLPTEEIMDLLNLCLASTYFSTTVNTTNGTAMGSPVSVVVAESAPSTCRQTIPLWLRYVDDTFTAVQHDEVNAFHHHLNGQNTDIQFTREVEENGKLPFLDYLVRRDDNSLRTTVYRKPTHTDRLLDESFCNSTSHKATTIRTLTRRA